jgi:hypothetical protein
MRTDFSLTENNACVATDNLLDHVLIKEDPYLDRRGVVFEGQASAQEYLDACVLMDAQLCSRSISRFIIRGVVDARFNEQKIISSISPHEGILEINRLSIDSTKDFLWIARNTKDRALTNEALNRFILKIRSNANKVHTTEASFQTEADKLYEIAGKNKFRIICNDPTGEFGKNRIDLRAYTSLMRGYFYTSRADCLKYWNCHGYAPGGHYLFGLIDQYNNLLGTYMMAKWPWGIEGTYTTIRRGVPRNLNCAQTMMLFSTALVLNKYKNELFYGEANAWNARQGIQSGFRILPPSLFSNYVTNVETADNAIRLDGELKEGDDDLIPPSYRETQYACYGIYSLGKELFTQTITTEAEKLLS